MLGGVFPAGVSAAAGLVGDVATPGLPASIAPADPAETLVEVAGEGSVGGGGWRDHGKTAAVAGG